VGGQAASAAPKPRDEEVALVKKMEAAWKVQEMERLKSERAKWEAEAAERLRAAEATWKLTEEQRMAEAMAAWRSDTDRIMLAKMRVAAEASRQSDAAEETTRPIPVKLIAAALLGLTLISGGIYGYIDGSLGESLMSLMAPEEPAVPAAPLIADAPRRQPQLPALPTWVVKDQDTNVRERPTTESPAVGTVSRDTVVTEIDRDGNWIKVPIPGSGNLEGWIHISRLQQVEATAAP
jgi:uncharacterized protein YgiM (DUF1202 family)